MRMTLLLDREGYFFELFGFIEFLQDWDRNFQIIN